MTAAFAAAVGTAETLVYLLTCVLVIAVGLRSLTHLRSAVEHHAMAQRISVDSVEWSKADSMFADTREPGVREYCQAVRSQGRPLRRAEAAVALERGRGTPPLSDTGMDAFCAHVREGQAGASRRDFATASSPTRRKRAVARKPSRTVADTL